MKTKWLASSPQAGRKNRSRFKVEALESRQLLASNVVGGKEVTSNADGDGVGPGTTVVDQVLMTKTSITVNTDPGQLTRVSWLDSDGDIVFAEFGGGSAVQTSLTITLDQSGNNAPLGKGPVVSPKYNAQTFPANLPATDPAGNSLAGLAGTQIKYLQGNATLTVSNADTSTYLSVYSLGNDPFRVDPALVATAFKNPPTSGALGANDGVANIKAIIIAANANAAGIGVAPGTVGQINFGGIGAANAVFSGDNGTVGIEATNVNVVSYVQIGDIRASDGGVPTLNFTNVQTGVVNVYGGRFTNTFFGNNGVVRGFTSVVGQNGESAFGPLVGNSRVAADGTRSPGAAIVSGDIGPAFANTNAAAITLATGDQTFTITAATTQADLDNFFTGRTFTGNVTVNGDLRPELGITAAAFRGNLTINGNLAGQLTLTPSGGSVTSGIGGTLTVTGDLSSAINIGSATSQARIGGVNVVGNITATGSITANQIGNVAVGKNLAGVLSTDSITANGLFSFANPVGGTGTPNVFEGAIGNVSVGGNLTGNIVGIGGVGNVAVTGNITGGGTNNNNSKIYTAGYDPINNANGNNAVTLGSFIRANVGTLTVTGDVDITATNLININNSGVFGNVAIAGTGSIITAPATTPTARLGAISIGTSLGVTGQNALSTGTITVAEPTAGTTVTFGGVTIGANTANVSIGGTIGAITFTGGGAGSILNLNNTIGVAAGQVGNNVVGADTIAVAGVTASAFQQINAAAAIRGSAVGNISLTAADVASTTGANGVATGVNFTGGVTANDSVANTGETIGNITLNAGQTNGTLNFTSTIATANVNSTSGATIGNVALTGRTLNDTGIVQSATLGTVTLTSDAAAQVVAPVGQPAAPITGLVIGAGAAFRASASVGAITINARSTITGDLIDGGDVAVNNVQLVTGNAGAITFNGNTTFAGGNFDTVDVNNVGAIAFNGTTVFNNESIHIRNNASTIVFTGATTFNGGTSGLLVGRTGAIAFNGATTFTTPGIIANDGTSTLDTIASLSFTGLITGTANITDVQASSIGAITITGDLGGAQSQTLVSNLRVVATNNGSVDANNAPNGETIAVDGSNLNNYSIGAITVSSTLSSAVIGSSLFSGDNRFIAQGSVGAVTITGGVSGNQQSFLFQPTAAGTTSTAGLTIAAGLRGAAGALTTGTDFNGDGGVGILAGAANAAANTTETTSNFTGGTVGVGNITVNARAPQANQTLPADDTRLAYISGNGTARTGLTVLSGLTAAATQVVVGNVNTALKVDADLKGTIGNVQITSTLGAQLAISGPFAMNTIVNAAGGPLSAIAAATSIGTIQGQNPALASGQAVILGDLNTAPDNTVDNFDQLLVLVV